MRLTNANGSLKLVNDTPSFTTTLRWRKSDNFQSTQRDWEAFWGFYWLYKDFPDHDSVENFIYAAFASANKVKHREKSIELGELLGEQDMEEVSCRRHFHHGQRLSRSRRKNCRLFPRACKCP